MPAKTIRRSELAAGVTRGASGTAAEGAARVTDH